MPVINTNVQSLIAQQALTVNNRSLSNAMSQLSTGKRINSAADDAAGLGVAEALKAAHHSSTVAGRNINDGISIIAVAEGSTNEVEAILIRMRELAVQSASETLANNERAYIQEEFVALSDEVNRISLVTAFNGINLADGSMSTMDVQVGIGNTSNDQITISLGDLRATVLAVDTVSINMATATAALASISNIDAAIASVSSIRSNFGSTENRLTSALNNIETFTETTIAAESRIRDADFGYETAQLTQNQILQQAGVSVLSQAKSLPQSALTLLQG